LVTSVSVELGCGFLGGALDVFSQLPAEHWQLFHVRKRAEAMAAILQRDPALERGG
jgi:hypothetical protein